MASRKVSSDRPGRRGRPATTPEARERQLIAAAQDLAEEQISNGTASSQVITHFLKLGSSREQLEQLKIKHENELLQVRRESISEQANMHALYEQAIAAMNTYSGRPAPVEEDNEEF